MMMMMMTSTPPPTVAPIMMYRVLDAGAAATRSLVALRMLNIMLGINVLHVLEPEGAIGVVSEQAVQDEAPAAENVFSGQTAQASADVAPSLL
jgi:hypothetical protein